MKRIILLFFALLALVLCGAQIQSTSMGGHWQDPSTWIGGVVPSGGDGVLINGPVLVGPATPCNALIVSPQGVLMNVSGVEGGVLISQDLINQGLIQSYAWGYNPGTLTLVIGGNAYNSGTIANNYISFNSFAPQMLGNTGTFNPWILTDGMSSSPLILTTDLVAGFGTNIDMNGSQLVLNNGTPHNLTLIYSGGQGSLTEASIIGGNGSRIIAVDGPRFEQVSADEVILEGNCNIVSFTANILHNYAGLFCPIYASGDLNILQSLYNYGSISNHPAGGTLNLYIYGDIFNWGTLSNQTLCFKGSNGHVLYLDDAAPAITCSVINTNGYPGDIQTYSDLRLSGCSVFLPGRMLVLGPGCSLTHTGGYLSSVHVYATFENNLTLNSLFMQDSEITGSSLYGYFEVKNTLTLSDVKNYATIQNFNYQSANIVTQFTFENHGILRNHPSGGTLNLSLDMLFYNYSEVSLTQINIINPSECYLWQDDNAPAISSPNVVVSNTGCVTRLLCDISFSNSIIDLAGSTLSLENSGLACQLTLNNSYLKNGTIHGATGSSIFGNAAFLSNITADILETRGTVFVYDTVTVGHLVNQGDIRNRDYWGGTLICSSRLDNYLNITNSLYGGSHSVEIKGDLYNYGTLSPHYVWVSGTADQYLRNAGTSNPELGFKLVSELGASQWYFNGELTGTEYVLNKSIDPYQLGIWQPFRDGVWGRQITLGAGSALAEPVLDCYRVDGVNRLDWNEVADAIFYRVYSAPAPEGPFSVYDSAVVDSNPGDGRVTLDVIPSHNLRFYKVTAYN